jgi:rhodanese-related sulfurtransferase
MSLVLGQIGFFQLSNLARNKVPFALFAIDFNPPENLAGDLKPIMAKAVVSSTAEVLDLVSEMNLSVEHPIVLICREGVESAAMSSQMVKNGFLNVYSVKNGWSGLVIEAGTAATR